MPPLFLGHAELTLVFDQIEAARLAVRRARRYSTKLESRAGQQCNKDLFDAEQALDEALGKLR